MDSDTLVKHFGRMGARLVVTQGGSARDLRVNVVRRNREEWFDVTAGPEVDVRVLNIRRDLRHLLLMGVVNGRKDKFLCGHDEREWFAAAIPEERGVGTVLAAMEALKPAEVRDAVARHGLDQRDTLKRRNRAFVRQGEWFFLPAPGVEIDPRVILRNEPLQRGSGKPHMVEQAVRLGGEVWYVCWKYPSGVSEQRYRQLLQQSSANANLGWRSMRRNPEVYVRGRVRHPDHATIRLIDWHRVHMNTENRAPAMRHLAFLD